MFSIFKKKSGSTQAIFSKLGTDMHSHLIPGIDDGAPDLETAIALVKGLKELGFTQLLTTPHVMADLYPNTSKIILEGLEKLRKGLKEAGVDMPVNAAAEYLLDEQFEAKIDAKDLLTLANNKVLVEMSFVSPPPNLDSLLFQLQTNGYSPIMAHPERYQYLHYDFEQYVRLKDRGCSFQLNLLSLTGYYGKAIKKIALKMLKNNMVEYLGTDLHHDQHLEYLQNALNDSKFTQLIETHSFQNAKLWSTI